MYNAFISYSHGADNNFAPALQSALQKFAKPWYKKRNLEIFRDESNLSVSPMLWNNITKAMDAAEFLILLASPASEKSKWVNKEIEYWLQHKSIDTILFALTEGSMHWDNERNCFLNPDCNSLPSVLDGAFDSEPFYIDMRQAKTEKDLSIDNPIFKKEVLKLAAKLHGLQPNDLASAEVMAHRKMIRIRNTAFTLLVCLFIAASVAGYIANQQKIKATYLAGSNTKLARAFESVYFYADRFALSNNLMGFYFTDKNGDKVEKLGEWEEAEQFNYTGYARVKKINLLSSLFENNEDSNTGVSDYIIDTSGNSYKSAYDPKDLDSTIIALDLADKRLETLPSVIFSNQQLQVLLLPNNKLRLLPESIGRLKNLKKLDLSQNRLTRLPTAIGELKDLEILDLRLNDLSSLPAAIGQLINLKELHLLISFQGLLLHNLDISPTYLDVIPKEIGLLQNLISLDMGITSHAVLPKEIGELKSLQNLILFAEDSASVPKEIWNLKDLRSLILNGILVDSLPREIGQFQNLRVLSLSAANLSILPEELYLLKDLGALSLGLNRLRAFPKQIGKLKYLWSLDISNNQLTELPAAISDLKQLVFLNISSNQLTTLPKEIGSLKTLSSLALSKNKLSLIPKEIGNLDSLNSLYLPGNELQSLPEEIGNLKMLTLLDLKENKLAILPTDIGRLSNLKSLDLSSNNLHSLPKEMGKLKNLRELTIYDNPLSDEEIMKIKELLPNCNINHSPGLLIP